jgi:hypothetical protein
MSESNGDLINKRIQIFRQELSLKYPKLANSDQLNCALDLARLILSTFTRDAQIRIEKLEAMFGRAMSIAKWLISFLTAILIALLSNRFMGFM